MKKLLFLLLLLCLCLPEARAQIQAPIGDDGIPMFWIPDVQIRAQGKKRDQRRFEQEMKKFNKLRYNVIKVYPYANECAKNLQIMNAELSRIPDQAGKDAYLKSRENFLFGKYEKELRDLTIAQGKILVKLIDRQTGNTTYSLISDYKNGATAMFWTGIGGIFGYNLKKEYNPREDDLAIEMIVQSIENGTNLSYYDYVQAVGGN